MQSSGTTKFVTDAGGRLVGSPIGAHVVYRYNGRELIGEVVGVEIDDSDGERLRVLRVRHFNGEPWPVKPYFLAVDVLIREYDDEEES